MNETASCPMCTARHVVPYFQGKESDAITCITCRGVYTIVAPAKAGGEFTTKIHRSMLAEPEQK